jgi:hypothetical protein
MHAWEGRCDILDGDQICLQHSVFRPKGASPPEARDVEGSPVNEAILMTLAEFPFLFPFPFPFSSVRELSRKICLPRSTVHRAPASAPAPHAIASLRFASRCNIFDGSLTFRRRNRSRFEFRWQSNYCRSSRCKESTRQWYDIVTLDEWWIYLFSEHQ